LDQAFHHLTVRIHIHEALLSVQPHVAECVRPRALQSRLAAHVISVLFHLLNRLGPRPFRDAVTQNRFEIGEALLQQSLYGIGGCSD
jgi:hypothetical protein